MDEKRLVGLTRPLGLLLWLLVAATVLARRVSSERFHLWAAAWGVGFAVFLALSIGRLPRWARLLLLGVEAPAIAAMTAVFANGFEGLLLLPLALELRFILTARPTYGWVIAQTLLFGAAVSWHWNAWSGCVLALPYGVVQVAFLVVSDAFHRERALRTELTALAPVLEAGSRNAERVRLGRELHDATGHRLTALALQLEVALHTGDAKTKVPIETSRTVVSELIDDMRRIVAATEQTDSQGFIDTLKELACHFPRPLVHLALPERLRLPDAERAHVLLRCSQEILTNSARHAGAQNLWLEITQDDAGLRLRARDDGAVTAVVHAGSGLKGMRGRLEALGGSLSYNPAPGGGLEVIASLPDQSPK